MYEDWTQNWLRNSRRISHTWYISFPLPHPLQLCADYSTAIDTTVNETERQQFSAVTVSLKSGFLRFSLKTLKFGLLWLQPLSTALITQWVSWTNYCGSCWT